MAGSLSCVKMRASLGGVHVSGAERIVPAADVPSVIAALYRRAAGHERGCPDAINIKVESLAAEPAHLTALPVATEPVDSPAAGWRRVDEILRAAGFARTDEIRARFRETYALRGAMLLDADTLERLEPDRARGVRATYMDATGPAGGDAGVKNHYREAVVLATKVLSAPHIVGEICMSDDPGYVTGYVATRAFGYRRITRLKEPGDPSGGRIFLYRGPRDAVAETIRYLEREPVLVDGVAPRPDAPPAAASRDAALAAELDALKAQGLWRTCRVAPAGLVNLSSNDYLALANDPRVTAAAAEAARRCGAGSGASRLVTGTQRPHLALEAHLAAFKGTEAALVYSTGYMANVGAITALVRRGDIVFSDALNHASIIDGCRMSGATVRVYRHLDLDDLARALAQAGGYRRRLVVSDAVFSMDGDLLDLPRFLDVCRRYDAFSMIDEAHALGVVGRTGRGLCETFASAHPDVLMGTLSKALGAQGGYICGRAPLVELLRQTSRPFIFNTAPNAAAMAGADAALTILEQEPARVARLQENVRFFRAELARAGVDVPAGTGGSAIVPILVGDERQALARADALAAAGFLISAIRYPTVARGAARLRVAVSAGHGRDELAAAALAIARAK